MVGGDAEVKVQHRNGILELQCLYCKRILELSAHGFQALADGLNSFLAQHHHDDGSAAAVAA